MCPLINKRETGVNLRRIMETISELDAPLKHHNSALIGLKPCKCCCNEIS